MQVFTFVLPRGIEPRLRVPQTRVLSIKLREHCSSQRYTNVPHSLFFFTAKDPNFS